MDMNQRNRNQIPWDEEIWNRIDRAVHDECKRTKIAAKFLPIHVPASPNQLTIPSDTVIVGNENEDRKLSVDEVAITPLLELVVEFKLTVQQVEREAELGTAITLATRAANLISQGEDIAIFQGNSAVGTSPGNSLVAPHPLFAQGIVDVKSGSAGRGLLNAPDAPGSNPDIQIIDVPTINPGETIPRWGENSFGAVSDAYSRLQSGEGLAQAHYGPYVCVFNFQPYADSYAPLSTTLIYPAYRICPLVSSMDYEDGMYGQGMHQGQKGMNMYGKELNYTYYQGHCKNYFGTGTLPRLRGIFLSLGGNTMDLVVGMDARTEYTNQDRDGNYCFRVYERFALRCKDSTAVARLEFAEGSVIGLDPG